MVLVGPFLSLGGREAGELGVGGRVLVVAVTWVVVPVMVSPVEGLLRLHIRLVFLVGPGGRVPQRFGPIAGAVVEGVPPVMVMGVVGVPVALVTVVGVLAGAVTLPESLLGPPQPLLIPHLPALTHGGRGGGHGAGVRGRAGVRGHGHAGTPGVAVLRVTLKGESELTVLGRNEASGARVFPQTFADLLLLKVLEAKLLLL